MVVDNNNSKDYIEISVNNKRESKIDDNKNFENVDYINERVRLCPATPPVADNNRTPPPIVSPHFTTINFPPHFTTYQILRCKFGFLLSKLKLKTYNFYYSFKFLQLWQISRKKLK